MKVLQSYSSGRLLNIAVGLALVGAAFVAQGCAILAGGAAGAATGYVAGHEAAK
jgi:hypothetical protein